MKLKDIIKDNDLNATIKGGTNADIQGISNDSRRIKSGYIFAARKGVNIDSNVYIEEAILNGAAAILTSEADCVKKIGDKNVAIIMAQDALKAYAVISKNFFKNPGQKIGMIGITGTNGKTTTAFLIKSILMNAENNAGLIGTIYYETCGNIINSGNTTPDAYELNKMLNDMVNSGAKYCVMEVSSHSLIQDRVYGIPYDIAVFTNLTRDHLDYHKDMEDYYQAKKKLFLEILLKSGKPKKFAVINNDDFYGKRLIRELKDALADRIALKNRAAGVGIITYGLGEGSDIFAKDISYFKDGLEFNVILPVGREKLKIYSKLIGSYNVYNILAACSAAYALSVPAGFIAGGVKTLLKVPGRVERVDVENVETPLICIDYAHTDDALKRVLSALRSISGGRLISIFGCGGDRDKGKRPLMGKHSTDIADITIITSDNPRSEKPLSIIKEIENGVEKAVFMDFLDVNLQDLGNKLQNIQDIHVYTIIKDRSDAIRTALSIATVNDTVLVAGKGHEDYMIVEGNKYHFSDKEEVLKFYEDNIQSYVR